MATDSRISKEVKSGLSTSLKWTHGERHFSIRVPAAEGTRALRDWLWARGEPAAQYTDKSGRIAAWQWRLEVGRDRAVWAAKGARLE